MLFFTGNRALITFCEHVFATNNMPMLRYHTNPFYAGILLTATIINSVQNCFGYATFVLLMQQSNLLPLRRDEPIDFRHLPVEVAHNLVLFLAGRERNLQPLEVLIMHIPLPNTNTIGKLIIVRLVTRGTQKHMKIAAVHILIIYVAHNVGGANDSVKLRYSK